MLTKWSLLSRSGIFLSNIILPCKTFTSYKMVIDKYQEFKVYCVANATSYYSYKKLCAKSSFCHSLLPSSLKIKFLNFSYFRNTMSTHSSATLPCKWCSHLFSFPYYLYSDYSQLYTSNLKSYSFTPTPEPNTHYLNEYFGKKSSSHFQHKLL